MNVTIVGNVNLASYRDHNHGAIIEGREGVKGSSPSAQNPISQPLKKANPSSHFTPSQPSL